MANWYYYDNDTAEKKGPITGRQLKALAASGTILPDTVIETEDGKQGSAGKVSGLFPPQTPPPENNSGMRFEPARSPAAPSAPPLMYVNINTAHVKQALQQRSRSLVGWILDFRFEDIWLLAIARLIMQVFYCLSLIITVCCYVGFVMQVIRTDEIPGYVLPFIIGGGTIGWVLGIIAIRLASEYFIVMLDWLKNTGEAAKLFIADHETESNESNEPNEQRESLYQ